MKKLVDIPSFLCYSYIKKGKYMSRYEYKIEENGVVLFEGCLAADSDGGMRKKILDKIRPSHKKYHAPLDIIVNGKKIFDSAEMTLLNAVFNRPTARKLQGRPEFPW